MFATVVAFITLLNLSSTLERNDRYPDICRLYSSQKLYIEFGTSGGLLADSKNRINEFDLWDGTQRKCSVQIITCPSCIVDVKFKQVPRSTGGFLNISRHCDRPPTAFVQCNYDYVLLHEPPFENVSGENYCGHFVENSFTELTYSSQTRFLNVDFLFTRDFGHAFTLEFVAKRNQKVFDGFPTVRHTNNVSQIITTPFFPQTYSSDLTLEYVVRCHSNKVCRISLLFTDFLVAESTILEFFDWNGQRLYVISGNVFRPPFIITSGPTLTIRFYANGASNMGFKALYYFHLGKFEDTAVRPSVDCGGQVNNLGGGITMMNMVLEGAKFYDCIWIVKIPTNILHRKTHLYVKVVNFTEFAGSTELILRKGITSNEPAVKVLKFPLSLFDSFNQEEHVVPISEGFYVSLRGFFKRESYFSLVYAAFSYKGCFSGLDFLCQNLRCISTFLNCDGFDHCGDNSDESAACSEDPQDRREYSKIPNFLFPKTEPYSDLATATVLFLLCTIGLLGIIIAMALFLYRVTLRAKHNRRMQDHLETIHAILEDGVSEVAEEEVVVPDEPPDYEPPPDYSDVLKYLKKMTCLNRERTSSTSLKTSVSDTPGDDTLRSMNRSCQTSPVRVPESPPPSYLKEAVNSSTVSNRIDIDDGDAANLAVDLPTAVLPSKNSFYSFSASLYQNLRNCKGSAVLNKRPMKRFSFSNSPLVRYCSDSEIFISSNKKLQVESVTKNCSSYNNICNRTV